MVSSDSTPDDADGTDSGVNRRTVIQGLGTGAVAGTVLVGTASGHQVQGKPVFCGCDQLCVSVDGNSDVLMAQEDDGAYDVGFVVDGELVPYPDGEPRYSGNFCVSTDDEGVPEGKIIGLQVDGTRWVNPNQCAQAALQAEREQLDSTHSRLEGESGTLCENPPGDGSGDGDDDIEVTWLDCETVTVTGSDEDLDEIVVHPIRCFPDGPCPDGVPGGRTIEDPDLPLTIDDQYLAVDGDDVPYYIAGIELRNDVTRSSFGKPDDLECDFDSPGEIDVTWEDCETVSVTGPDEDLDEITVHPMRCFPDGPCPDGVPGGRTIEDPDLPLTIDDQYLAVDGGDVPYYIVAIELQNGTTRTSFDKPDDLECDFDSPGEIDVTWEDCETVSLTGPDDDLDRIELYLMRCFDDPGLGCPDGQIVTRENPTLPLTLGRDELAVDDEEYRIDAVDLFGNVTPDDATPPDGLDCSFE